MRSRILWIGLILTCMSGCGDRDAGLRMRKVDLAQEWFRGIYGSDPGVVDKFAADDVYVTYPIFKTLFDTPVVRGKDAVKELAVGFAESWKDTEIEYHETIVQDDRVVLVWSFKGRNVASIREGVEPTNEIHSWGGITLIRFNKDGKIVAEIGEESEPGPMGRISAAGL